MEDELLIKVELPLEDWWFLQDVLEKYNRGRDGWTKEIMDEIAAQIPDRRLFLKSPGSG